MIQHAFIGVYVRGGDEWLTGTPMDFPEAFEGSDWEMFQPTPEDQQAAQKLVEDASAMFSTVFVRIFSTQEERDDWFRRVDSLSPKWIAGDEQLPKVSRRYVQNENGQRGVVVTDEIDAEHRYLVVNCATGVEQRWHFKEMTWLYLLAQDEW